jgi:hypothetical protein
MKPTTQILVFLGCLMIGAIPAKAQAQEAGTRSPVPHDQAISANPFLILFEWFNMEYERKISPTSTLGVGGSRFSLEGGDESYTGLNGFFRYYPQGAALSGFSLGGRLGFHSVSDDDDEGNAFGLGVDIGYSWLLGSKRNFYIGLGIGATRLFGGDIEEGRVVIPSIRLVNLGFAF